MDQSQPMQGLQELVNTIAQLQQQNAEMLQEMHNINARALAAEEARYGPVAQ